MNSSILDTEVQSYIDLHLKANPSDLILKGINFKGVTVQEVVEQIESKKRSELKLPTWFQTEFIYYPNKLNIEQTSSEIAAEYKASIINGTNIIDITGGFGVDSYYFAKKFQSVTHCEINNELSHIAKHNFDRLQVKNIETISGDGMEFLKNSDTKYDWIYIDPSRRHDLKGKVFFLKDCLPNVPDKLEFLFNHSNNIMVKASPLLDITAGIMELNGVKTIHTLAIQNEVKEVLFILEKEYTSDINVRTINISKQNREVFEFIYADELNADIIYSSPQNFLYEPNSAILKAGAFNSIASKLDVSKLHKHSHLYTSEELIDFPGRRFKIQKILPYHKKTIKKLGIQKANITTRNFPEPVEQIRKNLTIRDGGNDYLFFTTDMKDKKMVLICSKIN